MWRRLHTVRPAPAPWRDSHVNIYHDYYYYFNPPKSYPPTPPPSRAFKFPLTLLFTSTALQLGFRRGCDLLKLRFIFFPVWRKKKKKKSSAAFAHRERGSGPGLSALKNPPCSLLPQNFVFLSPPRLLFSFLSALRQTWGRTSRESRRCATRRVDLRSVS